MKLAQHLRAHHGNEWVKRCPARQELGRSPISSGTLPSRLGLTDLPVILGCVESERAQRVFRLAHGGLPSSNSTASPLCRWRGNCTPPLTLRCNARRFKLFFLGPRQ